MGGRARAYIIEVDLSARVPSFPGIYGAMVLPVPKGVPESVIMNSTEAKFLANHTYDGYIRPGDNLGMFEAVTFLEKSNKLYIVRPDSNQLYGGSVLNQDIPYNTIGVNVNLGKSALLLRSVTAQELSSSIVVWSTLSDGDNITLTVEPSTVSGVAKLPEPLLENTNYFVVKTGVVNEFNLASTHEKALLGEVIEFTSLGEGKVTVNLGTDKRNVELETGLLSPSSFQFNTESGKPAGVSSIFAVDLSNDCINVPEQFYNAVATGDELEILGNTAEPSVDMPELDSGTPLKAGSIVYAIKVPQEGINIDKFKVQLATSLLNANSGTNIGFLTAGGKLFGLHNTTTSDTSTVTIEPTTDAITVSTKFFKLIANNDIVTLDIGETGSWPTLNPNSTITNATVFYVIKGVTTIQLSTERNGTAVDFLTAGSGLKVTCKNKVSSTLNSGVQFDLSKDVLTVSESFYESTATGFAVEVSSTGTIPKGLTPKTEYYVIKLPDNKKLSLATTKANAELGITVDIYDAGTLTEEQEHTIKDRNTKTLNGYDRRCLLITTSSPCEDQVYYKCYHYPYGTENNWTDSEKRLAELVKEPGAFRLQIFKKNSSGEMNMVENFVMSRKEDHKDGMGSNIYCETVALRSMYIRIYDNKNINSSILPVNQDEFMKLTGGTNGDTITTGDMILALDKLRNTKRYPVTIIMDAGWSIPTYQQAIISVCEKRGSTLGILSSPIDLELGANYLQDLIDYRRTKLITSTSYAALYGPHLKIYDKYNDRYVLISPTGHVGAQISFTAANYEPWMPPAGNKRGMLNVTDVARVFDETDMDMLYDVGYNPIEFNETKGIRIWGQKTLLNRESALDRVNVRMLLIVIEPAIQEFLDDFVFEFNTVDTRSLAVNGITSYMVGIQSRQGVYTFMVQCDEENNTPEDIDNHIMNVWVFIQPVLSAEFIPCKMIITRTGASFTIG